MSRMEINGIPYIPESEAICAPAEGSPLETGKSYIIRTVSYHYIGRLVREGGGYLTLADASWLACSKRWADTLKTGEIDELEPYPDLCHVAIASIVDISPWLHDLPRDQK